MCASISFALQPAVVGCSMPDSPRRSTSAMNGRHNSSICLRIPCVSLPAMASLLLGVPANLAQPSGVHRPFCHVRPIPIDTIDCQRMTSRLRGDKYVVQGGAVLRGSVTISGAKNHALAAMCAALLTDEDVILEKVPDISDVDTLGALLVSLGATVGRPQGGALRLNCAGVDVFEAPTDLISENRASFQVMGPLLGRRGYASSAPPGGDVIGQRPIDVHLSGFAAMGAEVSREGERFVTRAPGGLSGTRVFMDYPSVSGTQNVMMAATVARGRTTIVNAAQEPAVDRKSVV